MQIDFEDFELIFLKKRYKFDLLFSGYLPYEATGITWYRWRQRRSLTFDPTAELASCAFRPHVTDAVVYTALLEDQLRLLENRVTAVNGFHSFLFREQIGAISPD